MVCPHSPSGSQKWVSKPASWRRRNRTRRAAASVDEARMIALDLEQANAAESPCLAFAAALAAMEREPSPVFLASLRRAMPPHAHASDGANTTALCDVLPARLAEVRADVARVAAHERHC